MAKTIAALALLLALPTLLGCGAGVTTVRDGRALTLPGGPPANACERDGFYELAPARVFARGQHEEMVGAFVTRVTTVESAPAGVAIFPVGTSEPLHLPDVLLDLGEPELASTHILRVEPIDAKIERRATWRAIALPVMIGMLAASTTLTLVGAATEDYGVMGVGLIGLGATLAVSLVALVGVLVNTPTAFEQVHADVRNRLFLESEDDLQAAARGVERHNQSVRAGCR